MLLGLGGTAMAETTLCTTFCATVLVVVEYFGEVLRRIVPRGDGNVTGETPLAKRPQVKRVKILENSKVFPSKTHPSNIVCPSITRHYAFPSRGFVGTKKLSK